MVRKASQAYYLAMHSLLRLHILKAQSRLKEGERKKVQLQAKIEAYNTEKKI